MNNLKVFYIHRFLLFWIIVTGCKTTEGLPENVVESVEKRIENGNHSSIAIAVIDNKGVSYYNFGKTGADGKLIDEHSIYEIGSISKIFTAVLLVQEVIEGNISLNDPHRPTSSRGFDYPF
jgi:serine-type D-Ala-D-Ala carboxypeptidase/endopeptidase